MDRGGLSASQVSRDLNTEVVSSSGQSRSADML